MFSKFTEAIKVFRDSNVSKKIQGDKCFQSFSKVINVFKVFQR